MKRYFRIVVLCAVLCSICICISVTALALGAPYTSYFGNSSYFPYLSQGTSYHNATGALQRFLLCYNTGTRQYILAAGGADGYYGSGTYNAVYSFQTSEGITHDGTVGGQTWGRICSCLSLNSSTHDLYLATPSYYGGNVFYESITPHILYAYNTTGSDKWSFEVTYLP